MKWNMEKSLEIEVGQVYKLIDGLDVVRVTEFFADFIYFQPIVKSNRLVYGNGIGKDYFSEIFFRKHFKSYPQYDTLLWKILNENT